MIGNISSCIFSLALEEYSKMLCVDLLKQQLKGVGKGYPLERKFWMDLSVLHNIFACAA